MILQHVIADVKVSSLIRVWLIDVLEDPLEIEWIKIKGCAISPVLRPYESDQSPKYVVMTIQRGMYPTFYSLHETRLSARQEVTALNKLMPSASTAQYIRIGCMKYMYFRL